MTEKARKLWLGIGNKWNDLTLGKEHNDTNRDFMFHLALFAFDFGVIASKNRKAMWIGGIITMMVGAMDFAGSDSLEEEILETMRKAVKDLDELSKSIIGK